MEDLIKHFAADVVKGLNDQTDLVVNAQGILTGVSDERWLGVYGSAPCNAKYTSLGPVSQTTPAGTGILGGRKTRRRRRKSKKTKSRKFHR